MNLLSRAKIIHMLWEILKEFPYRRTQRPRALEYLAQIFINMFQGYFIICEVEIVHFFTVGLVSWSDRMSNTPMSEVISCVIPTHFWVLVFHLTPFCLYQILLHRDGLSSLRYTLMTCTMSLNVACNSYTSHDILLLQWTLNPNPITSLWIGPWILAPCSGHWILISSDLLVSGGWCNLRQTSEQFERPLL